MQSLIFDYDTYTNEEKCAIADPVTCAEFEIKGSQATLATIFSFLSVRCLMK